MRAGARTLMAKAPENTDQCELSWRSAFWQQDLAYPIDYKFQCWNASGQTTSRIGTQPFYSLHPIADRVPKATLSSQPPLNTQLDMTLPTRGTRPSSTHQWEGTNPSYQEGCTSLTIDLTHQRADTKSKRSYNPPACRKETTNTESQTKCGSRETCSR